MAYVELVKQSLEDNKETILELLNEKSVDLRDEQEVVDTIVENFTYSDEITGNGSGSFTFSRSEARDIILDNLDDMVTILNEVGYNAFEEIGKALVEDNFEELDVIARTFVLSQSATEFASELVWWKLLTNHIWCDMMYI